MIEKKQTPAKKTATPSIRLMACKSSNVDAHGYDPITRTLAVKFKSGGTYHYHDVPPDTYAGLLKSESVGRALHPIKSKHKSTRIGD